MRAIDIPGSRAGGPRPLDDRGAAPAAPAAGGGEVPAERRSASMSPKERPGSPRVRLFVALELPEEFLEPLVGLARGRFRDRQDVRLPRPSRCT